MKFLRVLRVFSSQIPKPQFNSPVILSRFYSAQLEQEDPTIYKDENHDGVFDSSQFEIPSLHSVDSGKQEPTWDEKFRDRADRKLFGKKIDIKSNTKVVEREQQKRQRAANLARTLLEAALDGKNEEDENEIDSLSVKEEDQKSLSVGIIGAPNAGKSALTNFMELTKPEEVEHKEDVPAVTGPVESSGSEDDENRWSQFKSDL